MSLLYQVIQQDTVNNNNSFHTSNKYMYLLYQVTQQDTVNSNSLFYTSNKYMSLLLSSNTTGYCEQ